MTTGRVSELRNKTAYGCGLVAWDVVMGVGADIEYTGVGGTVGNVMSIMASLGWRSVPLVRLGKDAAAQRILRELVSIGVDTRGVSLDSNLQTPVIYQHNIRDQSHHSFSFNCPMCGHSRRFRDELLENLGFGKTAPPNAGDVYLFDRLTATSVRLAEEAKSKGALTVFEPSGKGADDTLFRRAVRAACVVKYSSERLEADVFPNLDCGFVEIQTMGSAGLRFRMRSLDPSWAVLPAIPAPAVVDTAGAGDWCTAVFLHLLLEGMSGSDCTPSDLGYNEVHRALRGGQAFAAMNCQHVGARGLMRSYDTQYLCDLVLRMGNSDLFGDFTLDRSAFVHAQAEEPAQSTTRISTANAEHQSAFLCCDSLVSVGRPH